MNRQPQLRQTGQTLYSARFDDFYAARENPRQEKQFVFCEGNALGERFPKAQEFTIAELGFGAGIGFLTTLQLWSRLAPATAKLHYLSVEQFPLNRTELRAALQAYPELSPFSDELLHHWPYEIPGFHRIHLPARQTFLTLIFMPALAALQQLSACVDAWFLDGFAPAKNPSMWQPKIFQEMARLSHAHSTFATYTAAAQVRRDLQAAGFEVQKTRGYGRKRERLIGRLSTGHSPKWRRPAYKPWLARPELPIRRPQHVAIIGAGIAGCATANRLAARGLRITLFDRGGHLAGGTSANPAAMMHPYLSVDANIATRLSRQGYEFTLATINTLEDNGHRSGFHPLGLLRLPKHHQDAKRQAQIAAQQDYPAEFLQLCAAHEASALSATATEEPGLYFPDGGWFELPTLCTALVAAFQPHIAFQPNTQITALQQENQTWQLLREDGVRCGPFDAVIIATGHASAQFSQTKALQIIPNRGQLSCLKSTWKPHTVVTRNGYITPTATGFCVGSTYAANREDAEITPQDNTLNLERLAAIATNQSIARDAQAIRAWAGIRATTSDRLPLVGPVAAATPFRDLFSSSLKGARRRPDQVPPYYPGLYLITGLGSRALTYGLLSAEHLAALILTEPLPIEYALYEAIHPSRLLVKAIQRGESVAEDSPDSEA